MARPLGGNSAQADSVTVAAMVPGRAPDRLATVTTSLAGLAGPAAPNQITLARGDSRMPAIPPAARPCGRTDKAPDRSS